MKKGSKLYSIVNRKCPHCHEGEFFTHHPYNLKRMGDIHQDCPVCKETYNPETGFYFGALYVSYSIGAAVVISILVAISVLSIEIDLLPKIVGISIFWLLISPLIHSMSKIIWANFFMNYKSK